MNPNQPLNSDREEPVEGLKELEAAAAPPEFLQRIRGKIDRRRTSAHRLALSWHVPRSILWEIAQLAAAFPAAFGASKGKSRWK